jgi:hypothetical protein
MTPCPLSTLRGTIIGFFVRSLKKVVERRKRGREEEEM